MRQHHAPIVLCLENAAGIAGPGFDAVDIVVEHCDVVRPVVRNVALLRAGQVQVDVALDLELGAVQHSFVFQAVADGLVDLGPEFVRGRKDRRSGA